jgi:hypothetical protein
MSSATNSQNDWIVCSQLADKKIQKRSSPSECNERFESVKCLSHSEGERRHWTIRLIEMSRRPEDLLLLLISLLRQQPVRSLVIVVNRSRQRQGKSGESISYLQKSGHCVISTILNAGQSIRIRMVKSFSFVCSLTPANGECVFVNSPLLRKSGIVIWHWDENRDENWKCFGFTNVSMIVMVISIAFPSTFSETSLSGMTMANTIRIMLIM